MYIGFSLLRNPKSWAENQYCQTQHQRKHEYVLEWNVIGFLGHSLRHLSCDEKGWFNKNIVKSRLVKLFIPIYFPFHVHKHESLVCPYFYRILCLCSDWAFTLPIVVLQIVRLIPNISNFCIYFKFPITF